MTTVLETPRATPDDVLRLEDKGLYELVNGNLVEQQMSSLASETAGLMTTELNMFLRQKPLGRIYPEQSFQCFPHEPERLRRPDIAFISTDRLAGVAEEGHVRIAPDLAIEVVSPTDTIYDLEEKLEDYHSAGVKLVWVMNPKSKRLQIYREGRLTSVLFAGDTLTGEPVLPGFSVAVNVLIPQPLPSQS